MTLLHGTSCQSDFLQRVIDQKTRAFKNQERVYPRQTTKRQVECIDDELDDAVSRTTAEFREECKAIAYRLGRFFSSSSQSSVYDVGRTFCEPGCGSTILAAYDACSEDGIVSKRNDFFTSLCGTNADGDRCYERYSNARSHESSTRDCYEDFRSSGQCRSFCRAELKDAVDDQGCCINVYYDLYSETTSFDPRTLHDACNVDIPDPCNSCVSCAATIATVITAVIFYAALS